MLIRSKKSKKTQNEDKLNRALSPAGQQRKQEAQSLQASVQGGLSDMVRQSPNGVLDDAQVDNFFEGLQEQSDAATPKGFGTVNPKIVKRYVMRNGKLCQIN